MSGDLEQFDSEVRVSVFRAFIDEGRAPVAAEIAGLLDSAPIEVERSFRRLHDSHMLVLAPGTPYIWMANPLSALPTPYAATCDGWTFWGNCIWDCLGIVAMLGGDGVVTCSCPDCGEGLRLEVVDSSLKASEHLIHFAVPAAHWWDDIGFN